MKQLMSRNTFRMLLTGTITLASLSLSPAYCQGIPDDAGYHNRQGLEYFNKGFYEHTPRHQDTEAARSYRLAVKEFTAAIEKDSTSAEAHRNLARVYYVQKNFAGAAEEYRRVTELSPDDLDAYVNASLACIELKRFDEAIQLLQSAKGRTSDPKALETLDSYIAKTTDQQAKGVKK